MKKPREKSKNKPKKKVVQCRTNTSLTFYVGKKQIVLAWLLLSCLVHPQQQNVDYPDWFLRPAHGKYVVGLSRNVSVQSVAIEQAQLDAKAMHALLKYGRIVVNTIGYKHRLADSLALILDESKKIPDIEIKLVNTESVGSLFLALFEIISPEDRRLERTSIDSVSNQRLTAIGKQTLHPDKVYESWASAEVTALKELSRMKMSKIRSLKKKAGSYSRTIVHLQSSTTFKQARINRRWVQGNLVCVEVSDIP